MNSITPTTVAEALQAAVEHHRNGRIEQATSMYGAVLAVEPGNFDALHLSGVAAHQRGESALALEFLEKALLANPASADALNNSGRVRSALGDLAGAESCFQKSLTVRPNDFGTHNELGGVLLAQGKAREAVGEYQRAAMLNPAFAGIHHNLGLAHARSGNHTAALRALREAWDRDPMLFAAAEQYVSTAATLARSADGVSTSTRPETAARRANPGFRTTVIVCSIDDAKQARVVDLYERLYEAWPHEIIVVRDARSLAEAYNRAIARSTGDTIVLSHDDIDILAEDFATRLHDYLQIHDVVGVMGSTTMTGPSWSWSGHPTLRGWISHHAPGDEDWAVDIVSPSRYAGGIAVLDGVFLAARRQVFDAIPFDESNFDGFHLYDIDWSYRAGMAGFDIAVAGDLLLVHESRGRYDPAWERYAERFCAKHGVGDVKPATHRQVFESKLTSRVQVEVFYNILTDVDSSHGGAASDHPGPSIAA